MLAVPVPFVIDHVTELFVAVVGSIVAIICNVPLSVVIVVAPPVPVTVILVTYTTSDEPYS